MRLLRLKSVLVATDLEETSLPALRTGARLAQLADAELHLAHVADAENAETAAGTDRLEEQLRRAVPEAPSPASFHVAAGDPAAAIVERADRIGADAIILGRHRHRSVAGGEMGSTASRVVRGARCPCLVVATELRLPLERVLAPIDLSETAEGALSVAFSWASALRPRGAQARIIALHVGSDPLAQATEERVREAVERARLHAGASSYVEIVSAIEPGRDAAAEILRRAGEDAVDLVVMGTRGESGAAPGFGGVSAAVARATRHPLLLVPAGTWAEHATP